MALPESLLEARARRAYERGRLLFGLKRGGLAPFVLPRTA